MSPTVQNPPHFHALACYFCKPNRLYRIFVRPDELVLIWAGAGQEGKNLARGAAVAGGLVGAAVAYAVQQSMDKSTAARLPALDTTPLEELMNDDSRNLRADVADFTEVRIAPRSPWHSILFSDQEHQGLLKFRHRVLGKMTLGLSTLDDLQIACAELPKLFGSVCHVELAGWSPQHNLAG